MTLNFRRISFILLSSLTLAAAAAALTLASTPALSANAQNIVTQRGEIQINQPTPDYTIAIVSFTSNVDIFTFTVPVAGMYTVETLRGSTDTNTHPTDTSLRLLDSAGMQLAENDDRGTLTVPDNILSRITMQLTPGTYQAQVRFVSTGASDGSGPYRLQVTNPNVIAASFSPATIVSGETSLFTINSGAMLAQTTTVNVAVSGATNDIANAADLNTTFTFPAMTATTHQILIRSLAIAGTATISINLTSPTTGAIFGPSSLQLTLTPSVFTNFQGEYVGTGTRLRYTAAHNGSVRFRTISVLPVVRTSTIDIAYTGDTGAISNLSSLPTSVTYEQGLSNGVQREFTINAANNTGRTATVMITFTTTDRRSVVSNGSTSVLGGNAIQLTVSPHPGFLIFTELSSAPVLSYQGGTGAPFDVMGGDTAYLNIGIGAGDSVPTPRTFTITVTDPTNVITNEAAFQGDLAWDAGRSGFLDIAVTASTVPTVVGTAFIDLTAADADTSFINPRLTLRVTPIGATVTVSFSPSVLQAGQNTDLIITASRLPRDIALVVTYMNGSALGSVFAGDSGSINVPLAASGMPTRTFNIPTVEATASVTTATVMLTTTTPFIVIPNPMAQVVVTPIPRIVLDATLSGQMSMVTVRGGQSASLNFNVTIGSVSPAASPRAVTVNVAFSDGRAAQMVTVPVGSGFAGTTITTDATRTTPTTVMITLTTTDTYTTITNPNLTLTINPQQNTVTITVMQAISGEDLVVRADRGASMNGRDVKVNLQITGDTSIISGTLTPQVTIPAGFFVGDARIPTVPGRGTDAVVSVTASSADGTFTSVSSGAQSGTITPNMTAQVFTVTFADSATVSGGNARLVEGGNDRWLRLQSQDPLVRDTTFTISVDLAGDAVTNESAIEQTIFVPAAGASAAEVFPRILITTNSALESRTIVVFTIASNDINSTGLDAQTLNVRPPRVTFDVMLQDTTVGGGENVQLTITASASLPRDVRLSIVFTDPNNTLANDNTINRTISMGANSLTTNRITDVNLAADQQLFLRVDTTDTFVTFAMQSNYKTVTVTPERSAFDIVLSETSVETGESTQVTVTARKALLRAVMIGSSASANQNIAISNGAAVFVTRTVAIGFTGPLSWTITTRAGLSTQETVTLRFDTANSNVVISGQVQTLTVTPPVIAFSVSLPTEAVANQRPALVITALGTSTGAFPRPVSIRTRLTSNPMDPSTMRDPGCGCPLIANASAFQVTQSFARTGMAQRIELMPDTAITKSATAEFQISVVGDNFVRITSPTVRIKITITPTVFDVTLSSVNTVAGQQTVLRVRPRETLLRDVFVRTILLNDTFNTITNAVPRSNQYNAGTLAVDGLLQRTLLTRADLGQVQRPIIQLSARDEASLFVYNGQALAMNNVPITVTPQIVNVNVSYPRRIVANETVTITLTPTAAVPRGITVRAGLIDPAIDAITTSGLPNFGITQGAPVARTLSFGTRYDLERAAIASFGFSGMSHNAPDNFVRYNFIGAGTGGSAPVTSGNTQTITIEPQPVMFEVTSSRTSVDPGGRVTLTVTPTSNIPRAVTVTLLVSRGAGAFRTTEPVTLTFSETNTVAQSVDLGVGRNVQSDTLIVFSPTSGDSFVQFQQPMVRVNLYADEYVPNLFLHNLPATGGLAINGALLYGLIALGSLMLAAAALVTLRALRQRRRS